MNWFDCLNSFSLVAKHSSFIGAARELSTTSSAITKQIQWLERRLSCDLFLRTTRKVMLTDAGEFLLQKVKPLLDEWDLTHSQIIDYKANPYGDISVCVISSIAGLDIFIETIGKFLEKYPHIRISLSTTHIPINLVDTKVDLLIGTQRHILNPNQTVGKKLFNFDFHCVAAPSYLSKHGTPKTPEDLLEHNCLIYRNLSGWEFNNKIYPTQGNLTNDSNTSLVLELKNGIGIGYIATYLAQPLLDNNHVQPILEDCTTVQDSIMAYYLKHEYKPTKLKLLTEFLHEKLGNY
jgi:DNA-binding transcriptional LysR family regulator